MEAKKIIEELLLESDAEIVQYSTDEAIKNHKERCYYLVELLEKQEQGMLIGLPCKVGDALYYIYGKEIVEVRVLRIEIAYTEIHIVTEYNSLGKIGKTLFFTRSEAESALAKMGGANEDTD